MQTNYLLPNKYKKFGWVLLIIGIIIGILFNAEVLEDDILQTKVLSIYNEGIFSKDDGFFKIIENGILDEIVALMIIIGGLIVGFSKEKLEDEFIFQLRKESLIWAIILNYIILMLAIIFIYDMTFLSVMIYNMFTPLLFFIIRFNFLKLKSGSDEE